MKSPIFNAKNVRLFENPGTLPDMNDALLQYFQPMVFSQIVKTVVNFKNVETPTDTLFRGVMQPFTDRQLLMKPEGQRSWIWQMLHAEPRLALKTDDVVTYHGVQYRVMSKKDFSDYGYVELHLVQDYTGSGP